MTTGRTGRTGSGRGIDPSDGRDLAGAPADQQAAALERALLHNAAVAAILVRAPRLELPSWHLGAGGVAQTVWNQLHGYEAGRGIKDYDLVYFDPLDTSRDSELDAEARARSLLADIDVTIDVTNEAGVHLWYGERFGRPIDPYASVQHAVRTWPTTASSVAVRYDATGFVVCAPFGLGDLFGMVVRPNKALVSREVFEAKAARWATWWPRLTVLPW